MRVLVLVVETLRNKDPIRENEVDRDGDDDGNQPGPKTTDEVGDIPHEPDEDKQEGYGFCVSVPVVFDQLGHLLQANTIL